jgi:hypothetical protein
MQNLALVYIGLLVVLLIVLPLALAALLTRLAKGKDRREAQASAEFPASKPNVTHG